MSGSHRTCPMENSGAFFAGDFVREFTGMSIRDFDPNNCGSYRGHGSSRGRGRGRGRGHYQGRMGHNKKSKPNHQKWNYNDEKQEKGKDFQNELFKNHDNACFRCGVQRHWSRTCRTLKHLVELYLASLKAKVKEVETNFVDHDEPINITHLDVSDFSKDPNGNIGHLIGDGHVNTN
ncbi:hypothetical protein Ddye_023916 [Dipteronia dyeriana]|uniref:CCHC-type domain-containing protein n=1 Tax=Dipteronia dyeriana TaxID=168575 RepID=A0AAD9WTP4_9ROSI|nr:hypothetical protein Ddye_023916 [Dipteronia dyeriana]